MKIDVKAFRTLALMSVMSKGLGLGDLVFQEEERMVLSGTFKDNEGMKSLFKHVRAQNIFALSETHSDDFTSLGRLYVYPLQDLSESIGTLGIICLENDYCLSSSKSSDEITLQARSGIKTPENIVFSLEPEGRGVKIIDVRTKCSLGYSSESSRVVLCGYHKIFLQPVLLESNDLPGRRTCIQSISGRYTHFERRDPSCNTCEPNFDIDTQCTLCLPGFYGIHCEFATEYEDSRPRSPSLRIRPHTLSVKGFFGNENDYRPPILASSDGAFEFFSEAKLQPLLIVVAGILSVGLLVIGGLWTREVVFRSKKAENIDALGPRSFRSKGLGFEHARNNKVFGSQHSSDEKITRKPSSNSTHIWWPETETKSLKHTSALMDTSSCDSSKESKTQKRLTPAQRCNLDMLNDTQSSEEGNSHFSKNRISRLRKAHTAGEAN